MKIARRPTVATLTDRCPLASMPLVACPTAALTKLDWLLSTSDIGREIRASSSKPLFGIPQAQPLTEHVGWRCQTE